ncbi:MAG TPA: copper oxidase, partial [Aestuariivirgaceae bacterium]|nr:copper oxidase [Aestuariivirgaceae bacterium]
KSHHTMNAMGHNVPTMIGVDQQGVAEKIKKLIPDYMVMGDTGGSMGDMEMPLPDNTLPMMTGTGQYGPIEMGGMFTVVKIREGLARNDYKDPGWYKQPPSTAAYEWTGEPLASIRAPGSEKMSPKSGETVLKVKKGSSHDRH